MRIEIRSDSVILDGYVNVTDRSSRILPSPRGRFKEVIVPKTFERALMNTQNVDLLYNHKKDHKLGSTQEGNLELREDSVGLRAIATITDPVVMEKAKNNELRGWSFGFQALADSWSDDIDGIQKRMVSEMNLLEVSVLSVTPAYIATSLEVRGEESLICEERTEEFSSTIEDNTEKTVETNPVIEEKRDEIPDYSLFEYEITILNMKGSQQ
jgi:HK97 family phage prohead protease